jgi:ATP-binding cassette, subfamily B, bacterial MsbA
LLKVFRRIDPRLSAELKSQRSSIVKGLACVSVTSLLTAATVKLIDFAGEGLEKAKPDQVGVAALLIVALYGVKYVFTRGVTYYLSRASNRLAANMRRRLMDKMLRLPIAYFNERRAGAIQSVFTSDLGVYQMAVTLVRDSIEGPIKAVGALVMIFIIQWKLALVALVFLPVMVFVIQRNARKVRAAQAQVQKDLADINAATHEAIQGTRIVKAFSAEERVAGSYQKLVEQTFESQMGATRRVATLRPLVELIGATGLAIVLYIGGHFAAQGDLRIAQLMSLIFALDVINQGMRNLASVSNTYSQVQAAADRIYGELLEVPEPSNEEAGKRTLAQCEGRIEFRNVTFHYPDGTPALRDVSFVIEPGTSLALVGPSGAGKSTIADLLLRFYDPSKGQILFDGVEVRELNAGWLRQQIGVVPQQNFLFAGTIADNIRLGAESATDEELREAARIAHALPFIENAPEGLQTELGERGVRLSGGEIQRIAIARAVARKPAVLLLDEATSNLDAVSEKAVQEALEEVMADRTTLFIAHRLTTAARADRILMLSRGEVVEQGTHAELMGADGAYAAMFAAFRRGVLDEDLG